MTGRMVDCPHCGVEFSVPQPETSMPEPPAETPAVPSRDTSFTTPNPNGKLGCPVCWLVSSKGDIMHIAVHDSLRGDPILGKDAQQRFLGHAL